MHRTLIRLAVTPALCALAAAAGLVSGPALAQEAASPVQKAAKPIEQSAAANVVAPESIEALKNMGAYLTGLRNFSVKSDFAADIVLNNHQKVQILGNTTYDVRRPDGLHARLVTDLGSKDFIYDGKQLTVVDPKEKVYAQVGVAPTIKQMLEQAAYHLDVELPLADLFDFGTDDAAQNRITEGFFVSDSNVNGMPAKHWAYRTKDKDFEVWVKDGAEPLPLRLVINNDAEATHPKFEADLHWSTNAVTPTDAFAFKPPEDYERIGFLELQGQTSGEGAK